MPQLLSQLPLCVTSAVTLLAASGVCLLIAAATGGNPKPHCLRLCNIRYHDGGIVTVLLHICYFW